jgi:hypothetical protein
MVVKREEKKGFSFFFEILLLFHLSDFGKEKKIWYEKLILSENMALHLFLTNNTI